MCRNGSFVISLDFELLWGVFDHETKDSFREYILGARRAIPQLLELFKKYEIHATWGVVGLLFADTKSEMEVYYPNSKPNYLNHKLSAYNHIKDVGANEESDMFHFASSIVDLIGEYENQEIGSHTFSHYYCKEKGQNEKMFEQDLESAIKIAKDKKNISLESLILPRNQFLDQYLDIIKDCGFSSVRGNPKHYAYNNSNLFARAIRLIDAYINICGFKCYCKEDCLQNGVINIRASRFFRKYSESLKMFENIKMSCIKQQMRYAARKGKVFHLWWHPHNLGRNTEINLRQIEELLEYYSKLKTKYIFSSKNMKELAGEILSENCNAMRKGSI